MLIFYNMWFCRSSNPTSNMSAMRGLFTVYFYSFCSAASCGLVAGAESLLRSSLGYDTGFHTVFTLFQNPSPLFPCAVPWVTSARQGLYLRGLPTFRTPESQLTGQCHLEILPRFSSGFLSRKKLHIGRKGQLPLFSSLFLLCHNAWKTVIPFRPFPFSNKKPHFQEDWSANYLLYSITKSDHCLFFFHH